ncbi:MAG TPA: MobA/MobL family protein [Steroidobacteraceae bacterium]|nr:MobA/MobL family protein [Steroidobacteraceae bacterium]
MAIFVFRMKTFSRSAGARGSRATSAAAYRAGERIRDLRTGATYDHRQRRDVLHREIVLPRALERSGASVSWARDRASLWNAAEHAEKQRNSRVAREFMLALPHELKDRERLQLARGFARELVERYHNAVDLVIHAPRGDPRNFHAHLLATTREVTSEGLSRKTSLEWSGTERHRQGLLRWGEERAWLRERWAALTNEALKAAHLEARVSHEIATRNPTQEPRLPSMAYHIERRGGHSVMAERIRARHHASLQQAASIYPTRTGELNERAVPVRPERLPWLQRVREQAQSTWMSLQRRLSAQRQASHLPERVVSVRNGPVPVPAREVEMHIPAPASTQARETALVASPTAQPPMAQRTWERQSAHFSVDAQALESIRRWKEYRARVAANPDVERQQSQAAAKSREVERGLDLDLGL